MPDPIQEIQHPPVSFFLKRGTLMGAALGMLAGLIYLSIVGVEPAGEVASIIFWRNCILIGAALGLILGGVVAWRFRSSPIESHHQKHHDESSTDARKTLPRPPTPGP